ncbi:MAG: imidazole glycerol phosphate synthase subunit HisH [Ramlibacter sp.]|nr:imidazole glycerol phosphate synthase subunit HisH [Ramlibacter sp.]
MSVPVTVLDYGIGNLLNVCRALEAVGGSVRVVQRAEAGLENADRLVLPGVGAFGDGMVEMRERGLDDVVRRFAATGRPFLGICVGMQMLFDASEEMGLNDGLGLMAGRVVAVPAVGVDGTPHRIPHIGWRELRACTDWNGTLLQDLPAGGRVYFVHSFAPRPEQAGVALAEADYDGQPICASVRQDNLWGCQFHPERSAAGGLRMLRRFLAL